MPNNVSLQRVMRAPPERVYRALTHPEAMAKWSPPHGFTGAVTDMDLRVGGGYKMHFTNLATGKKHSFGGTYRLLDPPHRIEYGDAFDAPGPAGEMHVTITIEPVLVGSRVTITQEGLPDEIPVEFAAMGWQESLHLLRLLVEAEVHEG